MRAKFHRVLVNLLQNAVRHTPARRRDPTSRPRTSAVTSAASAGDREVAGAIHVLDTGEGIAAARGLPHVFERSYRGRGVAPSPQPLDDGGER